MTMWRQVVKTKKNTSQSTTTTSTSGAHGMHSATCHHSAFGLGVVGLTEGSVLDLVNFDSELEFVWAGAGAWRRRS